MASPESPSAELSGQFEDLNVRVGARMQLLFPKASRVEGVASSLIGYCPHEFLIVRAPVVGGLVLKAHNDEALKARLFTGTNVVEFDTSVRRQFGGSVAYWHLAYPERIRVSTLRAALRAAVDLVATVELGGQGDPVPVRVADLSELGARVVAPAEIGAAGTTVRLKFSLPGPIGADTAEISATASIKAVRQLVGGEMRSHGLQFEEVSERDRLLMQNFVLLRLNDGRARTA
jgi:c-di-GMP-binding flagellar brake protein YcgR